MVSAAALLLGSAELALVEGPLRLPDPFLAPFVGGGVLTLWLDGCLALWPRPAWAELAARLLTLPVGSAEARAFERRLFASAVEADIPRAGASIPDEHRRSAGLRDRVVVVGAGDHLELWSPERWRAASERPLETGGLGI